MNEHIADILTRIRELEEKIESEVERGRALYGFDIKEDVAKFKDDVLVKHRQLRKSLAHFFRDSGVLNTLTVPIIYSLIIPIVIVDVWVTVYQHICFRAYGIERVTRSKYIIIDRHRLRYLNVIEAFNCFFCSYANGVIGYAREVASRTEKYWCPIKHALRIRDPHPRYPGFLEYGDGEGFRAKLEEYRENASKPE